MPVYVCIPTLTLSDRITNKTCALNSKLNDVSSYPIIG